jgi:hypothetical protein
MVGQQVAAGSASVLIPRGLVRTWPYLFDAAISASLLANACTSAAPRFPTDDPNYSSLEAPLVDRLLAAEEIAPKLGVRTQWVWAQARAGRIQHVRLEPYRRFRESAVEAWVCELEAETAPSGSRKSLHPGALTSSDGSATAATEPPTGYATADVTTSRRSPSRGSARDSGGRRPAQTNPPRREIVLYLCPVPLHAGRSLTHKRPLFAGLSLSRGDRI